MAKTFENKVTAAMESIRSILDDSPGKIPFIAFSGGKDSLALAGLVCEAIAPVKLPCVYVHHNFEFPENLDYVEEMRQYGFEIEVTKPYLGYFELMERGIEFLTRHDAWCVPMFVGTGIFEWLKSILITLEISRFR